MPPNCTQGLSEEDWERHKSDIHQKYLIQRKPVKDLIGEMSRRGYRVTCVISFLFFSFDACHTNTWSLPRKSQMETRLKKWKFQRHVKQDHWKYIRRQIEKRSNAGKSSCISLSGVVLDPDKVARETERYRSVRWGVRSMSYHPSHALVSLKLK